MDETVMLSDYCLPVSRLSTGETLMNVPESSFLKDSAKSSIQLRNEDHLVFQESPSCSRNLCPIAGGSSMGASTPSVVLHQIQGFHPRVMELTSPDLFKHPFIFEGKCVPLTQYRFKNITQMTALWYISSQCFVYLRSRTEAHTGQHGEIETGRQKMWALTRTCLLGAI